MCNVQQKVFIQKTVKKKRLPETETGNGSKESIIRSTYPEVIYIKCVLKNFVKTAGMQLCRRFFFFNKVAGLRAETLLKKRLDTCVFL